MRTRLALAATAAMLALTVPTRSSNAESTFVLKFGTMAPDGTPWADQLRGIEERIEAESGGKINVKLFLGGTQGAELAMLEMVQRGDRLQGGGFSTGAVGQALDLPILDMPELPYLFRSTAEADAVLDEVLLEPTTEALLTKGVTFYCWAENGWRNMGTKGGPAARLEDIQKYKMRSQENPVHLDMWAALGVKAIAKPTTEVLPALQTGIIDGFDNSPLLTMAAGWTDQITHYTLTRHIYQPAAVVYSASFYDSLPPDLQAVLMKDAAAEGVKGREGVRQLEADLLETMASMGVAVIEPTDDELLVLRKTTRPVHKQFLAKHQDMVPYYAAVKTKLKSMR